MLTNSIKKIVFWLSDLLVIVFLSLIKFKNIKFEKKSKKKLINKKCLILGNGPSLKNDIERVISLKNDVDIYVVNYFALTNYFILLKPKNYFFCDPMFWDDNATDAIKIKNLKVFEEIKKINWPMEIICRCEGYKKIKEQFQENVNIKIKYVKSKPINFKFLKSRLFALNYELSTPNFNNVLTLALWFCILNYNIDIELYGADFSQFKFFEVNQRNNQIEQVGQHFYGQSQGGPNSNKKYTNKKEKMMHTKLLGTYIGFYEMYIISLFAKSKGVKIINYSSNSLLDCFERP